MDAPYRRYLSLLPSLPSLLSLNETWLDKSVGSITVPGYTLVSRLDRRDGRKAGGIVFFALDIFFENVSFVMESPVFERCWHIVHTNFGPLLVANWYRPPDAGEVVSIDSLEIEYSKLQKDAIGTVIVGDMNVHNIRWLRYFFFTISGRCLKGESFNDEASF